MKITSIRYIDNSEIPLLRPIRRTWVFEPEEGVIGADSDVLCPTCGWCTLKQVPKLFPDLLGRPTEVLVLVCPSGCTKTKSHGHRRAIKEGIRKAKAAKA
jgi:hypothetical protein